MSAKDGIDDLGGGLFFDGDVAIRAILGSERQEKHSQIRMDFGSGCDGRLPAALGEALFDCDGRRQMEDFSDIRFCLRLNELAGVGIDAFEKAGLTGREEDIESKRGFSGAGDACHDGKCVKGDFDVDIAQIVFTCALDEDKRRFIVAGFGIATG